MAKLSLYTLLLFMFVLLVAPMASGLTPDMWGTCREGCYHSTRQICEPGWWDPCCYMEGNPSMCVECWRAGSCWEQECCTCAGTMVCR